MSAEDRLLAAIHAGAVGNQTIAGLQSKLKERLRTVALRFALETKTNRRAPDVLDGWLPPKAESDVERFPFLLVRPSQGTDTAQGADENATAVFVVVIGTYSDTDDGATDVLLLIDAIRADLGEAPAIDGTAYEHVGPLTWQIPEQQARPQWVGVVTTNWQIPRPQRVEARNPEGR